MKNLFKSLMLVAVAAMAFTACQKDNGEVNAVAKKTVITGVAVIDADDTRSGFVGSEEKDNGDGTTTTVYKSAWKGGENIKLFAAGVPETTAIIDAEGKFTAQFDGELTEPFITVCSPAASWTSQYTCNIPEVQTPSANSVDPAAHILQAQGVYVIDGTASFSMNHSVAYGKMTVNTPAEFVIDHVDIELNGAWYGYDKSLSYTINAANVENNTFWFATDVIEVAAFTVTAYDAEGNAYTKNVTVPENGLLFQYGRVSTFSVSDLKTNEEPAEPAGIVFTSSLLEASSGFGDFYINFSDGAGLKLRLNFYNCQEAHKNFLPEGTYNVSTYNGVGCIYYDASATYTFAEKDGEKTAILEGAVVVSVSNGAYKFEVDIVTSAFGAIKGTYEGAVEGLVLPSEYVEPEVSEPQELTIYYHKTSYGGTPGAGEHELTFCYDDVNNLFLTIDFLASPITAGTYTLDNGLYGTYCRSHNSNMKECTVVVTDNGDGTLTFDASFVVNYDAYYFTYTAQIYS